MTPKQLVQEWVRRFNAADIEGLAALYAEDAINHQVVMEPLHGRAAIRHMYTTEFGRAQMVCLVENLFEDGEWAILEWRDPNGLRGCGFFHVQQGSIVFQRGYFDQLSFFRLNQLPAQLVVLAGKRIADRLDRFQAIQTLALELRLVARDSDVVVLEQLLLHRFLDEGILQRVAADQHQFFPGQIELAHGDE
eukprot:gene2376-3091_t